MIVDRFRFVHSWPGRHSHDDNLERVITVRPKLKVCAQRYRVRTTRHQGDRSLVAIHRAPQLALARQNIPDLLNSLVPDSLGDSACWQPAMDHAATLKHRQKANLRSIRGLNVYDLRYSHTLQSAQFPSSSGLLVRAPNTVPIVMIVTSAIIGKNH